MTSAPWAADRPLDLSRARAAIERQFPDLRPARVTYLASGWDHDVYASGDWVFRFPRRRVVADDQPREIAALELAAGALAPLGVFVPRAERRGRPCDSFPYPFTGCRRAPGRPGDRLAAPGPALARGLGRAVAALHAIPVEHARALPDAVRDAAARHAELGRRADAIPGRLPEPLRSHCRAWLRTGPPAPPAQDGPPRFLHNDLSDEHVYVDPAGDRPVAMLDFGDAALGDPALDLVGPALWVGPALYETLLGAYAPRRPRAFDARLRFLMRACALLWVDEDAAATGGRHRARLLRWVRHAFARGD